MELYKSIQTLHSQEKITIKSGKIPKQPKERYYGNREYKRRINNCNNEKIIKRSTQMLFRLHEGNGKAVYMIGVDDNGEIFGLTETELLDSIKNIVKITKKINSEIKKISIYSYPCCYNGFNEKRFIVILRIYKLIEDLYI